MSSLSKKITMLFCVCNTALFAQTTNIIGQSTIAPTPAIYTGPLSFLLIPTDARSMGLGCTGAATEPDDFSVVWNPAKLGFIKDTTSFAVTYVPWERQLVPDMNLSEFTFSQRLSGNEAVELSIRYMSSDEIINPNVYPTNQYSVDATYARRLSSTFSLGMTVRYTYSDLRGTSYGNRANSLSFDLSGYRQGREFNFLGMKGNLAEGIDVSNIWGITSIKGNDTNPVFLPANLRLGGRFTVQLDKLNKISVMEDLNKLLVPTPPVYQLSSSGKMVLNSNGQPVILAGMNPDVSAPEGMAQSFYDAPGGALQEFQEITWSTGIEYTYADMFAARVGYFYENPTEGGRQFFSMGAGFRLTRLTIDASYVMPIIQQSPLQNTLCISMSFNLSNRKHSTRPVTS